MLSNTPLFSIPLCFYSQETTVKRNISSIRPLPHLLPLHSGSCPQHSTNKTLPEVTNNLLIAKYNRQLCIFLLFLFLFLGSLQNMSLPLLEDFFSLGFHNTSIVPPLPSYPLISFFFIESSTFFACFSNVARTL